MNKLLLLLILLFMFSPVFALDNNPNNWGSIVNPSWSYIESYWGGSSTEKVQGMFGYTLEPWELEVCATHTTNDLKYVEPEGFSSTSTDLTNIYAPITASLSGQKHSYADNLTLIEISFYIQPKDSETIFSIYMKKGNSKYYIAKYKKAVSDPLQGYVDYHAEYYETNFTDVVMEYESGQIILTTPIVEKK